MRTIELLALGLPFVIGAYAASIPDLNPDEAAARAELQEMQKRLEKTHGNDMAGSGWATIEILDRLTKLGKPAGPEVLKWFLDRKVPLPMRSLLGSEVLPRIVDQRAMSPLNTIVRDKGEPVQVRAAAVKAMGAIGGKDALRAVLPLADNDQQSQPMQVTIIRSLGNIGDKEAVPLLVRRLRHQDPYVGIVAARALHSIAMKTGDTSIEAPLLELVEDKSFQYNGVVAGLLAESNNLNVIPVLARAIQDPANSEQTRWAAAKSLAKIGGEEAVKALIPVFEDNSEYMRIQAVQAAFEAGIGADKVPLLEHALQSTKDEIARRRIQGIIYRLGGRFGPHAREWTHDRCVSMGDKVYNEGQACKKMKSADQKACFDAMPSKLPEGMFLNCGCLLAPAYAQYGSKGCDPP